VPVEVLRGKRPPFPVLGREGFFQAFDILFRLGPVPERGMFCLSPRHLDDHSIPGRLVARSDHRRRALCG